MNNGRLEASDVAAYARGRWDNIYASLAPKLGEAVAKKGRHVPCPVHGGTDGFRLHKTGDNGQGICNTCDAFVRHGERVWLDGFGVLMWATGKSFPDVLHEVAEIVAPHLVDRRIQKPHRPAPVYTPPPRKEEDIEEDHRKVEVMRATWASARPLTDQRAALAWRYLESRGLPGPREVQGIWDSLRFVPDLLYRDVNTGEKDRFPGIVALLHTREGQVCGVHRIYLARDGYGKAPVEMPKKLMAKPESVSMRSAAVRMGSPDRVIAVTEGVETAMAVRAFTGFTVWATYSATILRQFEPPKGTQGVHIFGDKDRVERGEEGQKATADLAEALKGLGYHVRADIPPGEIPVGQKSLDWLDVYNELGQRAITKVESLRHALARQTVTPFPIGARRAG